MLITTTPGIEGKRISRYCGIVTGEAILGANVFKELFAGIRDIVGGRSATYEAELQLPGVLVLGSESHGLSAAVTALQAQVISIPRVGQAESLNVAMAASALCMEFTRQRMRR